MCVCVCVCTVRIFHVGMVRLTNIYNSLSRLLPGFEP